MRVERDREDAARAEPADEGLADTEAIEDGGFGAGATVVPAEPSEPGFEHEERSFSEVTRVEMDERQPRSTPDALRYEAGVAVQETAHGQASPYLRGRTGQQVVHLFDGIRLNTGIYRQGPNQYFVTVDQQSLDSIEVIRGAASVRFGSDAIGGALLANPSFLDPTLARARPSIRSELTLRYGSADDSFGLRGSLDFWLGPKTTGRIGVGFRRAGLLRSGGVVGDREGPTRGDIAPWVPRFVEEADAPGQPSEWFTQLGTGFRETTFDLRIDHALERYRLSVATYGFRQRDLPRTDQCPSAEAPLDECLRFDRQDRSLAYVALERTQGDFVHRLVFSYQRHVEERRRERPRSFLQFRWRDVVDTLGVAMQLGTKPLRMGRHTLQLLGGVDLYGDQITESSAERLFTDISVLRPLERAQYLPGANYLNTGAFVNLRAQLGQRVVFDAGLRAGFVRAGLPGGDGMAADHRRFFAPGSHAGARVLLTDSLSVFARFDQGFRAPNLDDLVGRQTVGPGFQFENPELAPEISYGGEAGIRLRTEGLSLDAAGYATRLSSAISRVVRNVDDCPGGNPECRASRTPFQLVNADERSRLYGFDLRLRIQPHRSLLFRTTVSFAWGDGPSLGDNPTGGEERVPLSRVPPLQGSAELRYRLPAWTGLSFSAALRWSAPQERLAISDGSDPRIPTGGTPGFAVVDLRAMLRLSSLFSAGLIVENLGDAAYRVHGSSINGAGRGARLWMRLRY